MWNGGCRWGLKGACCSGWERVDFVDGARGRGMWEGLMETGLVGGPSEWD